VISAPKVLGQPTHIRSSRDQSATRTSEGNPITERRNQSTLAERIGCAIRVGTLKSRKRPAIGPFRVPRLSAELAAALAVKFAILMLIKCALFPSHPTAQEVSEGIAERMAGSTPLVQPSSSASHLPEVTK